MARLQFGDAETEMEIMAAHTSRAPSKGTTTESKSRTWKVLIPSTKIEIDIFCDAVSDT